MPETIIHSNGSSPGDLDALFQRFAENLLEARFEANGCLRETVNGRVSFFGNFADYSHVFRIETDDPDLTARLDAAIAAQQQRTEYQAMLAECRCEIAEREAKRMNVTF